MDKTELSNLVEENLGAILKLFAEFRDSLTPSSPRFDSMLYDHLTCSRHDRYSLKRDNAEIGKVTEILSEAIKKLEKDKKTPVSSRNELYYSLLEKELAPSSRDMRERNICSWEFSVMDAFIKTKYFIEDSIPFGRKLEALTPVRSKLSLIDERISECRNACHRIIKGDLEGEHEKDEEEAGQKLQDPIESILNGMSLDSYVNKMRKDVLKMTLLKRIMREDKASIPPSFSYGVLYIIERIVYENSKTFQSIFSIACSINRSLSVEGYEKYKINRRHMDDFYDPKCVTHSWLDPCIDLIINLVNYSGAAYNEIMKSNVSRERYGVEIEPPKLYDETFYVFKRLIDILAEEGREYIPLEEAHEINAKMIEIYNNGWIKAQKWVNSRVSSNSFEKPKSVILFNDAMDLFAYRLNKNEDYFISTAKKQGFKVIENENKNK